MSFVSWQLTNFFFVRNAVTLFDKHMFTSENKI